MQKLRAGVVTRVLAVAALTGLTLLGAVTVQAQSQSQAQAQANVQHSRNDVIHTQTTRISCCSRSSEGQYASRRRVQENTGNQGY